MKRIFIALAILIGATAQSQNVATTLMQLQDETLAFERTELSVAVKKAIVDALK